MNDHSGMSGRTLRLTAPGKLNLTLEVGPPRADGYHPLASVMVPVSLADELMLQRRDDCEIELFIRMADPMAVPVGDADDNLVVRAARLLQQYVINDREAPCGVTMTLTKHIPVAAGLAGGSADAAAVLIGLNELWGLGLTDVTLAELGVQLGADVPFCIRSRAAIVEGIGEQYTPLRGVPALPIVLVNPRQPLSTAGVFQRFDAMATEPSPPGDRTVRMVRALYSGDPETIAAALFNDLAEPAKQLLPEMHRMERCLTAAEPLGVMVTGSGPTMFALARNDGHAQRIAQHCREYALANEADWWIWHGWAGNVDAAAGGFVCEAGSGNIHTTT